MNNILLNGIILVTIIIIIVAYRLVRSLGSSLSMEIQNKEHDSKYLREILSRDRKIQMLQSSIDNLNVLNHRYLSFMIKVPTIVQRMNSTLSIEEVNTSVIHLVSDIIQKKLNFITLIQKIMCSEHCLHLNMERTGKSHMQSARE